MKRFLLIGAAVLALLAALSFYRERLVPHGASPERRAWLLTGDEPCYLMAAQAAASGDGMNLRPVRERKAYLAFQKRDVMTASLYTWGFYQRAGLRAWVDRSRAWGNVQIRHHLPLYPFIIAPLTGTERIRWSVGCFQAFLVGVAAFVVLWTYARSAKKVWPAALVVVLFLGGLPAGYYTTQIYPETLAGVLVTLALCAVLQDTARARRLGYVLLFISMWVSPRVMGGMLAVTGWEMVRQFTARRQWGDTLCFVIGWLAYCGYHLAVWGVPLPPAYDPANQVTLRLLPMGLLRSLFANEVGLLVLNPALWVGVVAGLVQWLWKPSDRATVFWSLFFVGTWAGVAMLPVTRAGTCPAGRYQVLMAYLLVFPAVRALTSEALPLWRKRLFWALIGLAPLTVIISYAVGLAPNYWFRAYHPLFGYPGLQRYYGWLPDPKSAWFMAQCVLWLGVLTGILYLREAVLRVVQTWRERAAGRSVREAGAG